MDHAGYATRVFPSSNPNVSVTKLIIPTVISGTIFLALSHRPESFQSTCKAPAPLAQIFEAGHVHQRPALAGHGQVISAVITGSSPAGRVRLSHIRKGGALWLRGVTRPAEMMRCNQDVLTRLRNPAADLGDAETRRICRRRGGFRGLGGCHAGGVGSFQAVLMRRRADLFRMRLW